MQRFSRLKRPIYITETGIPDAKDCIRAEWAEAYFKAVRSLAQAALLRAALTVAAAIPHHEWLHQT